jgi:serine/threonine protein kinase
VTAESRGARTPVTVPDPEGADSGAPLPAVESDRYVLEREIGSGGMGRVFAARDLRLQRAVAIKMLRVRDGGLVGRFEREVKLAARLQHPGVVPVYDAGFWPSGEPYLVMKLVLGQSLARVIRDADTPADRLALLPHVITVAEAVAFAHDQGVVHRDLKPINILVGAFGETIVLDWGLAKDLRAPAKKTTTKPRPRRPPRRSWATRPRAPYWARLRTWRPSRPRAASSTPAPTSTPWARSSTTCWRAPRRTHPR